MNLTFLPFNNTRFPHFDKKSLYNNCMYLQEVIVVEGKNDTRRLQMFFDVDTIETDGYRLRPEVLALIREVNERRGVIVFTDPDTPGENLRRRINEAVPGAKNAFLLKKDARTKHKVGVEHASKEVLEEALSRFLTYTEKKEETLSLADFQDLGLCGRADSGARRQKVAAAFPVGEVNAKTMRQRLNILGVKKEDIERIL